MFFAVTASVFLSAYFGYPFVVLALAIVGAGLFEVVRWHRRDARMAVVAVPVYLLIGVLFFLFALRSRVTIIASIYAVITALDGFSQVAGQWFGRTKLAPRISPSKTIEGLAGGILASVIAYAALVNFTLSATNVVALVLVLIAGFCGDLLASAYKRHMGIKDFSALIPYHGGVLDRFDSFIAAGSVYVALSRFGVGL